MNGEGGYSRRRKVGVEAVLLIATGLFMGTIGPFGTDAVRIIPRLSYWLICMVGGGVVGILLDRLVASVFTRIAVRTALVAAAMTPVVALLVIAAGHFLIRQPLGLSAYTELLWKVFVVSAAAMAVRASVWRHSEPIVQTRTIIEAPLPEAEAVFRRRLSAKRRAARLIAVEAHDHYLRVHTDTGMELITMRFADALGELAQAHGYRVHRSWWVAAAAIDGVQWRRGSGELRLVGDLTAPVSRAYKDVIVAAGWC